MIPTKKARNAKAAMSPSFQAEEDEDGGWVYAMDGGKRVGEIAWQVGHDPTRVEFKALSVKKEWRGNGLGQELLQHAVAYVKTRHPQAKVAWGDVYSGSALRAWGRVFPTTEVRNWEHRLRTLEGMARRLDGYGFEPNREPPEPCYVESPFPRSGKA